MKKLLLIMIAVLVVSLSFGQKVKMAQVDGLIVALKGKVSVSDTLTSIDYFVPKTGGSYTGTHNFTGATLTAPTKAAGTNSTDVATTAYVDNHFENIGFTVLIVPQSTVATLADATTYTFGFNSALSIGTNSYQLVMPVNCTLVGWATSVASTATPSNEASSLYIRINGADNLLTNAMVMKTRYTDGTMYGTCNINFSAGDKYDFKLVTGTFATDPTVFYMAVTLFFKNR